MLKYDNRQNQKDQKDNCDRCGDRPVAVAGKFVEQNSTDHLDVPAAQQVGYYIFTGGRSWVPANEHVF